MSQESGWVYGIIHIYIKALHTLTKENWETTEKLKNEREITHISIAQVHHCQYLGSCSFILVFFSPNIVVNRHLLN